MILLYNFLSVFHNKSSTGDLRSPKNTSKTQKQPPYRKILSRVHFPFTIISTSTSRNNNIVFPCKLCSKNVNNIDAAIQCDKCQFWVHLRCNKLNLVDYKYFQGSTDPWFCLSCCSAILPFGNLTDNDFSCSILNKNYIETSNKNSSVLLKPSPNLELLFNQFKNPSPEQQNDPENVVNSRYFDIDQIQSLKCSQKEKSLSLPY